MRKETFNYLSRSLFFRNPPVACADFQRIEDETSSPPHGEYAGRTAASFTIFGLLIFDRMRCRVATFASFRVDIRTKWVYLPKKNLDDPSTTACTSAMRSTRVYKSSRHSPINFIISSCAAAESTKRNEHGCAVWRKYLWNGLTEAESILFSVLERGQ